ncbi:hypothetical protein BM526_19030 (plasmid) [Alteromonas mediterranea]|uniref:hypothetical protein n=1 Tax=Alteromonas mediterranea TaxID=314275 RepID=UPI000903534A|nr:hypothetical protein [Alteromonas mediterranea]APE04065.1 hypothetical protein BM526_19030 [Alteromonas mediterranea]
MCNKTFETTHPKNSHNVIVEYDANLRLVNATYEDGEDVDLTDVVKAHLQDDINHFASFQLS